ncbi:hypothetical protein [Luteococcus sp.]|uniref:hypothetical protein n=1 Tax=Luteococcus sp. TaxID=1969402 RepID=UPI0037354142
MSLNLITKPFKRRVPEPSTALHGLQDIDIVEVRDLDGHYVGFLADASRAQATMLSRVTDAATVTPDALGMWEASLVGMESLLATVSTLTVAEDEPSWSLSATMQAVGRDERRDPTELATRLATSAPAIYRQAGDSGFHSRPLSSSEVVSFGQLHWSPLHPASWPPRAAIVEEGPSEVTVDGNTHVVFEVTCDGDGTVLEMLASIIQDLGPRVDATFRLARVFRPAAGLDKTSSGRRVGLLTISYEAGRRDTGTYLAALCLAQLDARARLRVRRLFGRQQLGMGMALGLGVLGWQHLEVIL